MPVVHLLWRAWCCLSHMYQGRRKKGGGVGTRLPYPQIMAEQLRNQYLNQSKEVCNGGVACSLLKLGSLEKTVIASLFHSGLHSSSPFFVEKTTLYDLLPS